MTKNICVWVIKHIGNGHYENTHKRKFWIRVEKLSRLLYYCVTDNIQLF